MLLRCTPLALLAAFVVAATAQAHPERTTFFPDHTKSAVPALPSYKGGTQRIVCKPSSRRLVRSLYKTNRKLRAERLNMLRRCRYDHVQQAVNAARSGDKILIFPGVYREEPSRAVNVDSSTDECGPLEQPEDGDAPVPTYEYQLKCPNAKNLIAILGDPDHADDNRTCQQKCNLLLRGMGRKPGDVKIMGDRLKKDVIRGDRADGLVIYNLAAEQGARNDIDLVETNGFRLERLTVRWAQNYGILTFTSDNGLYDRIEAYGSGDSGVYPGSGPEGHCERYGIEIRNSKVYRNNMGFSGTAGNGTWYHHNEFYDNGAGGINDSFVTGHPGMPQDCSKWTNNLIHGNNWGEIYDAEHDRYCVETPFEKRKREYVCPQFQIPIGTGIGLYGGNNNVFTDNYIYDQWRDAFRLFWVPAAIRGENDPSKQQDTSNGNRYERNILGIRPDGTRDPNGMDVLWDEEGQGNCWQDNRTNGTLKSDPATLPACPGSEILSTGNPNKTASQVSCATWDPKESPDPPGCDWFTTPPEPK